MKSLLIIVCSAFVCLSCGPATSPSTRATSTVRIIDPDSNGKVIKTDSEWKKLLTADQYYILRQKGTEPAFHNAYFDNHEAGTYYCAGCGNELFTSATKFESGTGWPSFFKPAADRSVQVTQDADGQRDEVL